MTLTGHIVGTKGNTGRGIASIVENADYTITINLTDGSSYTTAPIAGFTAVDFDENYDLVVTKTDGTTETVETDIEAFRTVLAGYKSDAETAESNASGYATAASGSASTATSQATLAKSYAKGGTSSRTGEDTDNADYYRGLAAASATAAGTSESNAGTQALKSEGYAVGKQNGTDVSSGSDYYHNNAKYYSDMAHIDATDASDSQSSASGSASTASAQALKSEGYAVGKQNGTDVTSGSDYYQNNSKYYKEQAATSASSASTNALKAEGFAVGEQNGTAVSSGSPYYENNAEYYAGEAADSATAAAASAASLTVDDEISSSSTNPVQNKVIKDELDSKANIDGYYESLGSGTADQLASNIYEEDNVPYNFRTSGGSIDIGDRETDMVVGCTVAWNQLVKNGNFANTNNWSGQYCSISASDNVLTANATAENVAGRIEQEVTLIAGHKYLFKENIKVSANATSRFAYRYSGGIKYTASLNATANTWGELATVFSADTQGDSGMLYLYYSNSTALAVGGTAQYKNVMLIDLTQMFGTTIADYIYNLDQANAGAGVAWFKKLFPKPYYEYNAGELMSVQASSHDMVGFNAWDEEWEVGVYNTTTGEKSSSSTQIRSKNYIRVLPNTVYWFNAPSGVYARKFYYDADKNFVATYVDQGSGSITIPSNCYYMTFQLGSEYGTTYKNDICINLSWDGERDGEYEAYVKHSYPLDSSLTLRGIPKLDASNNLYYDGDTYESDGTVTRKYGKMAVPSSVQYMSSILEGTNTVRVSIGNSAIGMMPHNDDTQCMIADFPTYLPDVMYSPNNDFEGISTNKHATNQVIWLRIAKTKLSAYTYQGISDYLQAHPITMVYELATPTTETADPYTNPQIVNDFGTEEYVDYAVSQGLRDVAIPVGHETQYMANLKAKLEMSPNSPEGAGDYIVRQTNGENEYVTLASNATIQDIIARLEALEGGE